VGKRSCDAYWRGAAPICLERVDTAQPSVEMDPELVYDPVFDDELTLLANSIETMNPTCLLLQLTMPFEEYGTNWPHIFPVMVGGCWYLIPLCARDRERSEACQRRSSESVCPSESQRKSELERVPLSNQHLRLPHTLPDALRNFDIPPRIV